MSVTSCISWIPKGFAKTNPDKVRLSDDDLKRIFDEEVANDPLDEDIPEYVENASSDPEDITLYKLENYDREEIDEKDEKDFVKLSNLATFHSNKLDKYITDQVESDIDSDELEDWKIKDSDNLLACGVVNDSEGSLEIYVYNKDEDSFYVHHDVMLPYLPISCEWLSYDSYIKDADMSNSKDIEHGNFLAVGGMKSFIDIWDLDIVDTIQPYYTLKHRGETDKKKFKGVLGLAWNRAAQKVLASSVASGYVNTWDLSIGAKLQNFKCHTDKVGSISWHPEEANLLLTGSSDKSCVLIDCRIPRGDNPLEFDSQRWKLENEVESLLWNTASPYQFLVASNDGFVNCFDCRNKSDKIFSLRAHDVASEGLSICLRYPYLLTCSANESTAKLWNIGNDSGPSFITRKRIDLKQIHSVHLLPDPSQDLTTVKESDTNGSLIAAFAGIGSSKPVIAAIRTNPQRANEIPNLADEIKEELALGLEAKEKHANQNKIKSAMASLSKKTKSNKRDNSDQISHNTQNHSDELQTSHDKKIGKSKKREKIIGESNVASTSTSSSTISRKKIKKGKLKI